MAGPGAETYEQLQQRLQALDRLQGTPLGSKGAEGVYQMRPAAPPDPGIDPRMPSMLPFPFRQSPSGDRWRPPKDAQAPPAEGEGLPTWQKLAAIIGPLAAAIILKGKGGGPVRSAMNKATPGVAKALEESPTVWRLRSPVGPIEKMGIPDESFSAEGFIRPLQGAFSPKDIQRLQKHPRYAESLNQPAFDFYLRNPGAQGGPTVRGDITDFAPSTILAHEGQHALPNVENIPRTILDFFQRGLHSKRLERPDAHGWLRHGIEEYPDLPTMFATVSRTEPFRPWVAWGELANELLSRQNIVSKIPDAYRPTSQTLHHTFVPREGHELPRSVQANIDEWIKHLVKMLDRRGEIPLPLSSTVSNPNERLRTVYDILRDSLPTP